jgi:hypothetical protein
LRVGQDLDNGAFHPYASMMVGDGYVW